MTLGVVVLAVFVSGAAQAQPTESERSQNVQLVRVANGLLTLDVHEALLSDLIEEIARQSGLVLEGQTSLIERITAQFQQMRLDEALRVVLDGQSYALEYSLVAGDGGGLGRIPTRLRIFRREGGSRASSGPANHEDQANLGNVSIDLPRLAAVLEGPDDGDGQFDKWDAIEALGESGQAEGALPLLRFALADQDEDVRQAAVEALATLGGAGAAEALEIALRDQESWIREEAIEALEAIGGDRAAQSLVVALQDEDADLREQAVEALGELGGPTALQLLEYAWAADSDDAVRTAAAEWLEVLRDKSR